QNCWLFLMFIKYLVAQPVGGTCPTWEASLRGSMGAGTGHDARASAGCTSSEDAPRQSHHELCPLSDQPPSCVRAQYFARQWRLQYDQERVQPQVRQSLILSLENRRGMSLPGLVS